jgi:hypothetical protein
LLVRTGYGLKEAQKLAGKKTAAVVVDDLPAAAAWIVGAANRPTVAS